jgi:hypothetical protein
VCDVLCVVPSSPALALPDYHWLCLGLLSLVIRLPFSIAMPHFLSRTIGSGLTVCS